MSSIIFAGSSQFIATQMIGAGTSGLMILLVVFVVNLRHALYSASVAPHVRHLNLGWKFLLSYLLTDEAYAVTITHYNQEGDPTQQALVLPGRRPDPVVRLADKHGDRHLRRAQACSRIGRWVLSFHLLSLP